MTQETSNEKQRSVTRNGLRVPINKNLSQKTLQTHKNDSNMHIMIQTGVRKRNCVLQHCHIRKTWHTIAKMIKNLGKSDKILPAQITGSFGHHHLHLQEQT